MSLQPRTPRRWPSQLLALRRAGGMDMNAATFAQGGQGLLVLAAGSGVTPNQRLLQRGDHELAVWSRPDSPRSAGAPPHTPGSRGASGSGAFAPRAYAGSEVGDGVSVPSTTPPHGQGAARLAKIQHHGPRAQCASGARSRTALYAHAHQQSRAASAAGGWPHVLEAVVRVSPPCAGAPARQQCLPQRPLHGTVHLLTLSNRNGRSNSFELRSQCARTWSDAPACPPRPAAAPPSRRRRRTAAVGVHHGVVRLAACAHQLAKTLQRQPLAGVCRATTCDRRMVTRPAPRAPAKIRGQRLEAAAARRAGHRTWPLLSNCLCPACPHLDAPSPDDFALLHASAAHDRPRRWTVLWMMMGFAVIIVSAVVALV